MELPSVTVHLLHQHASAFFQAFFEALLDVNHLPFTTFGGEATLMCYV